MMVDKDMARRFQRARDERVDWEKHYPGLLAQYPDEWVAVHDGRVIAHESHIWNLMQGLERQGVDRRDVWITFLNESRRAVSL